MTRQPQADNTVCRNKKATFRFELLERFDCGIELLGTEVKSLREHEVSLEEAYARIDDDELFLVDCRITPYRFGTSSNHPPTRKRKLLAHRREIRKLKNELKLKGLTLVPLRIYFNDRGLAKVQLALARGKNVSDKRQDLKAKEHQREMARASTRRR